ncbi:MAG: carotenoid biosynthesis protein [Microgenomates group bacterium]
MRTSLIWIVVIVFAMFNACKPLIAGTAFEPLLPLVSILAPVLFVLMHGPAQIGWRRLGLFFVLTCVISWSYESLSIATGFPFGNYHYTDSLGPKLGTVPLLIMPAYFGVSYISWLIADLLIANPLGKTNSILVRSIVAGFVMVMWDLSMDPARATVNQAWIWHDGGAYFGVPFKNFAGWFLCVLTIFLTYGAASARFEPKAELPLTRNTAMQVVGLYAALFLEFVAYLVITPVGTVTDAVGQIWNLRDIYESLALVSLFTMGFVIALSATKIQTMKTN